MDNLSRNSHELPAPSRGVEVFEPNLNDGAEKDTTNAEVSKNTNSTPNKQVSTPTQSSSTATTSQSPITDNNSSTPSDINAQDLDVIEKAWVDKAKKVISDTRNDPRQQNLEIAKVKAEYIKKRFNKDLVTGSGK